MEHPTEAQALPHEHDAHDEGDGGGEDQSQNADFQTQHAQRERAQRAKTHEPRASELALDPEDPALATVVLTGDLDPRPGPEAAVNLEIPVAPSLVHQDQVFARGHGLTHPVQEGFLIESVISLEHYGNCKITPRQAYGRPWTSTGRLGPGE